MGISSLGGRNTREVVPVRLSDAERAQIASAATRRQTTLSGFIRQAALQASAIVTERASVKTPEPPAREPVMIDLDRGRPRIVDGMLLRPDGTVTDWDEGA